jgi:hypothetical protein
MASLLAPVKAAVAADAALLSQESKSLFSDVRNCRAAVSHLQVNADFTCFVCYGKVTLQIFSGCCSVEVSAATLSLQSEELLKILTCASGEMHHRGFVHMQHINKYCNQRSCLNRDFSLQLWFSLDCPVKRQ